MNPFMGENFLLEGTCAKILYEEYARDMPILDYHTHLSAKEIYKSRRYENLTQAWLENASGKWRAMRAYGVDERYITGNAPDYEKYTHWVQVLERLPGSPLYHWTHLELKRYFGVDEPLRSQTAQSIWDTCNERLRQPGFDARGLLTEMGIKCLCTTDDPFDSLEWHAKLQSEGIVPCRVLPTFRPDKITNIEAEDWPAWLERLGARYGVRISDFGALTHALMAALAHFVKNGCVIADHAIPQFHCTHSGDAEAVFQKRISGKALRADEILVFQSALVRFLAARYAENGIAMQLHIGALRNQNMRMLHRLGADSGFDSIGAATDPQNLCDFLSHLDACGQLPKTILYGLNPADQPVLATLSLNYACGGTRGKVQLGSAWWFSDNMRGIDRQLDNLIETGLLPVFVGMVTDSRSFLSFVRHEYFRRLLCRRLGGMMDRGEYPADYDTMGDIVRDICYRNAERFLFTPY